MLAPTLARGQDAPILPPSTVRSLRHADPYPLAVATGFLLATGPAGADSLSTDLADPAAVPFGRHRGGRRVFVSARADHAAGAGVARKNLCLTCCARHLVRRRC